jgi:hypothetical protein
MKDEIIHIVEETEDRAGKAGARFSEELSVRGSELQETLGRLAGEARVRKITVKSQSGRTLANIPLVLGVAGVLIIGPWTAALLAAAWLSRVSILIEYEEAPAKVEKAVEEIAGQIEAAAA